MKGPRSQSSGSSESLLSPPETRSLAPPLESMMGSDVGHAARLSLSPMSIYRLPVKYVSGAGCYVLWGP